jgi:peptidoglycan/LPS O-acetylase OafA/YrhL
MKYMKQLDSLRALAVLAVLYTHFLGDHLEPLPFFVKSFHWGSLGVSFFFTLSGFLITSILLQQKDQLDSGLATATNCIKTFYFRRMLRIFPIYYLALFVAYLISLPPVRETLIWHLFYLTNLYVVVNGDWNGSISHLWSLAVEEQFYLIWPFIIFCVSQRRLKWVILAIILLAPVFRHLCFMFDLGFGLGHAQPVMLFANTDLLGLGALLALIRHEKWPSADKMLRMCLVAGGTLFFGSTLISLMGMNNAHMRPFGMTIAGIFFVWIIDTAVSGFTGVIGWLLNRKELIFIGKISYGVYLYHIFIYFFLLRLVSLQNIHFVHRAVITTVLTIVVATVSYFCVERSIQSLKNRSAKVER